MKKLSFSLFLIALVLLLSSCHEFLIPEDKRLEVHFIDVGQGDATLILSSDGKSMLIDAGNNGKGSHLVSYLKEVGVEKIDVLIGTHPDSDHIGGMDVVIEHFDIGTFYMPMKYHETKTFNDVLQAAKRKNLKIQPAFAGQRFDFADHVRTIFLSPVQDKYYADTNSYSAVVKMEYGKSSFLFMGDADKKNETDMIDAGYDLSADILKLGHHGSSTSTSEAFLEAVSPDAVVISAGYRNKHGHPHKKVLQLLKQKNIPLYRTDEQGNIVIRSDAQTLTSNLSYGSYTYRKP